MRQRVFAFADDPEERRWDPASHRRLILRMAEAIERVFEAEQQRRKHEHDERRNPSSSGSAGA